MAVLSEHSLPIGDSLDSKCSGMSRCRHDGVGRRHDARGDVGGDAGTAVSRRRAQSSRVDPRPVGRVAPRLRVQVGPSVRLVRGGVGPIVVCRGALGSGWRNVLRSPRRSWSACRPTGSPHGIGGAGHRASAGHCRAGQHVQQLPTNAHSRCRHGEPRESWGPWFAASSYGRSPQRHPPNACSSSLSSEIMASRRSSCFAVAGGPYDPARPDLPGAGGAPPDRGSSVPGCGVALSLHCRGRGG